MAISDPILQKRNKINKSINKNLTNIRSGILSSPNAVQAARQTLVNTTNKNDEILNILSQIDAASKSGTFYVITDVPKMSVRKICDYFARKRYIVAAFQYRGNKNKLCIYWGGGKKWQKARIGNNASPVEVGTKMAKELIEAATSIGDTPTMWDLYSPNVKNFDKIDENKVATALYSKGNALP